MVFAPGVLNLERLAMTWTAQCKRSSCSLLQPSGVDPWIEGCGVGLLRGSGPADCGFWIDFAPGIFCFAVCLLSVPDFGMAISWSTPLEFLPASETCQIKDGTVANFFDPCADEETAPFVPEVNCGFFAD